MVTFPPTLNLREGPPVWSGWWGALFCCCCSGLPPFYTRSYSRFLVPALLPVIGAQLVRGVISALTVSQKDRMLRKRSDLPKGRCHQHTSEFFCTWNSPRQIQLENVLRGSCDAKHHKHVRIFTAIRTKCMNLNAGIKIYRRCSRGKSCSMESQGPYQTPTSPATCSQAHCGPCSDLHTHLMPASL